MPLPPVVIAAAEGGCDENPNAICRWAAETFNNDFIANLLGSVVPDILRIVAIFAIAWVINRLVRRFIRRLVEQMLEEQDGGGPIASLRRAGPLASTQQVNPQRTAMRTQTVGSVLRSVSTLVIWSIAILVAIGSLRTVELNIGPLIASAGIVGVALGFGAQSLVKDFLTGIFMLMEDQYGIGDIVNVGEATGVVERISLRKTQLRDLEGTVWHVPNGEITRVGNLSQLWSRSLLDLGVAYDTDLRHAISVIDRVASDLARDPEWEGFVLEPPEVWGVENWADSAITIRLVVKTQPAKQWDVNRQLRLRLKEAFDAEGIEIPFPQRGLWFKNGADVGDDAVPSSAQREQRSSDGADATRPAPPEAVADARRSTGQQVGSDEGAPDGDEGGRS